METWKMLGNLVLVGGMTLLLIIITYLLRFRKQLPHRLLCIFFVSVFFFLLYHFGYVHRSRAIGGVAVLVANGTGFLWGPLFLYYIRSLSFPQKQVIRALLWHLVPFGVNFLFMSVPRSLNMLADFFPGFMDWYMSVVDYIFIIEDCYIIVYFIICIRLIARLKVMYSNSYSDAEGKDLDWCRQLIVALAAIAVLDLGTAVYAISFHVEWNFGVVPAFLFVALIAFFAFKGMWQIQAPVPEFLLEEEFLNNSAPAHKEPVLAGNQAGTVVKSPHALGSFSQQEITVLKDRLTEVLETQKPYLDDSLTLSDLAAMIPLSDKKLSELLNQHVCISFYDLINNCRVETVKEKMRSREAERYTLLAIGFDSGFKSKSSFNRVFKQKTGVSPSQYYERCRRKD